jgi:hypothetical protein
MSLHKAFMLGALLKVCSVFYLGGEGAEGRGVLYGEPAVVQLLQLLVETLLLPQPLLQLPLLPREARHLEAPRLLRIGERGEGAQHAPYVLALVQARRLEVVDILQINIMNDLCIAGCGRAYS